MIAGPVRGTCSARSPSAGSRRAATARRSARGPVEHARTYAGRRDRPGRGETPRPPGWAPAGNTSYWCCEINRHRPARPRRVPAREAGPGTRWRGSSSNAVRRPRPRWPSGWGSRRPPSGGTSTLWSADGSARRGAQPRVRRRPAGRGRPARIFALTDAGRGRFPHAYDDLASRRCATCARPAASRGGRLRRAPGRGRWPSGTTTRSSPGAAGDQPRGARRRRSPPSGYAASVRQRGRAGEQLCQHHCPVAHVAAEFPQLCEAETEVVSKVARPPRPAAGHHRPRRRGLHHLHPGRPHTAAPAPSQAHERLTS